MIRRLLPLFLLLAGLARAADAVSVAAAANLVYALDAINAEFRKTAPDVALTSASGASGSLVAQIKNGAPYDVFLSADLDYPRALVAAGQAEAPTLTVFATGRLVLWSVKPGLAVNDIAAVVKNPAVHKLAIANPDTAPYGRAAREALDKLGLTAAAQPKLVVGENITQTAQFVETGNADAGFVALSLVLSPKLARRGTWFEVPAALHAPLDHGAVLTRRGAANPAARRYLEFLRSAPARKILREFGYAVPAAP
ncbi:MAG: molybdate ABC transporter substrate-binding protein [Verrucomicrobia bacterium]|nr:molybdate ABC transporter substrate-binding protein [Verrucomicrobiota bacterium]